MWKEIKNQENHWIFTSIVHNKEQYRKECALLCTKTFKNYYDKNTTVISEWEEWHKLFNTEEYKKCDCNNDYTNPLEYKGAFFKHNPKENEYPLMLMYNYTITDFYYQTLKEE